MSEKGLETHPEVQEGLGDPPGGPGRVGIPTRMSGKGRETHPGVREWSGDPPGGTGSYGSTHPEVREVSADPLDGPRRVGRPSQRYGKGRGTYPEVL